MTLAILGVVAALVPLLVRWIVTAVVVVVIDSARTTRLGEF